MTKCLVWRVYQRHTRFTAIKYVDRLRKGVLTRPKFIHAKMCFLFQIFHCFHGNFQMDILLNWDIQFHDDILLNDDIFLHWVVILKLFIFCNIIYIKFVTEHYRLPYICYNPSKHPAIHPHLLECDVVFHWIYKAYVNIGSLRRTRNVILLKAMNFPNLKTTAVSSALWMANKWINKVPNSRVKLARAAY